MEFNKLLDTGEVDSNEINFLWDYRPLSRGNQDKISEDLLLLKHLHQKVPFSSENKEKINIFAGSFTKYFVKRLDYYANQYIFCLVPSHNSGTDNKQGIHMFSRWTRFIRDEFDKDIIIRTQDIESLHSGGDRAIETQLRSLKINKNVKGKRIVVMDDITTTGHSLEACKILLEQAGAKEVILFAFGKTKSYYRQ